MSIQKKTNALFRLMEIFLERKEISSYDKDILSEFDCNKKTLERYLNEIESSYPHIIGIKKGRKKVWKLVRVSDIFEEFISNSYDLTNLFDLAQGFDPEIFRELEKGTLSKIARNDESLFLFKNSIMEEMRGEKSKKIFKALKVAIRNYEYRDIVYSYDTTEIYKKEKCLKLMFMDNNWYLVVVDEQDRLRFRRLSFIDEVRYSSNRNSSYQKKEIEPYLEFLKSVQNAMSLYGVEVKRATIRATPNIAKYFEEGMKRFLPSQSFVSRESDGSVIFTLEYTQELEILPFVQKWLPDLVILEPEELRMAYISKLEQSIKNHDIC